MFDVVKNLGLDIPSEVSTLSQESGIPELWGGSVPTVFLVDQTSVSAIATSMFMADISASVGTGLRQKKSRKAESDPNRCVVSSEDIHSFILEASILVVPRHMRMTSWRSVKVDESKQMKMKPALTRPPAKCLRTNH